MLPLVFSNKSTLISVLLSPSPPLWN